MLWYLGIVCTWNTEEGNGVPSGGVSRKAAQGRGLERQQAFVGKVTVGV